MILDFNAIEIFVRTVQAGSLSEASRRTHVPLATLSRRIIALEKQLQVRLFERGSQGVKLTEQGSRFFEYAVQGVETLHDGIHQLHADEKKIQGLLRLSIPPSFTPWWSLLQAFQQTYPLIDLKIFSTDQRMNLTNDSIDVALRVGDVVHEQMIARRLLSYRHVLVASPAFLAKHGVPTAPEDILSLPCAGWSKMDDELHWNLGGDLLTPRSTLLTNNYQHLHQVALSGDVITELPPFIAKESIQARQLVPLLIDYPMPEQQLNLLYPSRRYLSSVVRAYLDFCQAEIGKFMDVA
ncbi:LysR family transcriptional regulator [Aquirhabdus sp.]|uniref:LysR family transcriptional regulator n=1 Tax=Aquirhabdus sp. TaxID=2824160 RepID=UPI00396CB85C